MVRGHALPGDGPHGFLFASLGSAAEIAPPGAQDSHEARPALQQGMRYGRLLGQCQALEASRHTKVPYSLDFTFVASLARPWFPSGCAACGMETARHLPKGPTPDRLETLRRFTPPILRVRSREEP